MLGGGGGGAALGSANRRGRRRVGAPPTGGALLWGPGGKWRPEGPEAALAARRPVGPAGRGRAASGLMVPAQRHSEEHEGNGEASSFKNNKK